MTANANERLVPPYVSFATLLNQLERMEREGVPKRIDPSYLVGMAGGTQNQFKHALRSMGLITEESVATELLMRLAEDPAGRNELMKSILTERYPELVALDTNATRGQLDEAFQVLGIAGADTRRKAASFFVNAAQYAGIALSPLFTTGRPPSGGTSARRPKRTKQPAKPSTRQVGGDDMRRTYFELLVDKAKSSEEPAPDLLDRIERIIGVIAEPNPPAEPGA